MGDENALLVELLSLVRVQSRPALREVLSQALSTDNDRTVYDLTDGSRNQTEVAKQVGISSRAVGYKWEAWRVQGLLLDGPDPRKPRHLASISFVGGL